MLILKLILINFHLPQKFPHKLLTNNFMFLNNNDRDFLKRKKKFHVFTIKFCYQNFFSALLTRSENYLIKCNLLTFYAFVQTFFSIFCIYISKQQRMTFLCHLSHAFIDDFHCHVSTFSFHLFSITFFMYLFDKFTVFLFKLCDSNNRKKNIIR